jgi:DNA-binding PadR family transcriptional regulator
MVTTSATKTDLLLLGLLLDRPMHGYELYQQIQSEGIANWYTISAAGVYYSLHKLRDQGAVAESRQPKGESARKAIYRITEKGRNTFFEAMDEELASQDEVSLDYDLVVFLLNKLPSRRVIDRMEKRQAFLADQATSVQTAVSRHRQEDGPPLTLAILDHRRRFLAMEQDWLTDIICSIKEESEACSAKDRLERGLMSLSGDLGDFHLPDLFSLIVTGQHSGTLSVTDGADIRSLTFEQGQPVSASHLKRGEDPIPLTSCEQVLEGLCELFRWREGRFVFDQRMIYQDYSVPVDCTAEDLILRGCRKVDTWDIIQQLVPSADTIFEMGSAAPDLSRLSLTPTEQMIVQATDGVRDVASIARNLDLTLFETSRAIYCLAAVGVLRTADLDRIRMRRVFREIAELMCAKTIPWRATPEDRTCEEQVNDLSRHLSIRLDGGRVQDETDPKLAIDELQDAYRCFLQNQFTVVSRSFGHTNARTSYRQALSQLAPELQDAAKRYGFHEVVTN